jgi:hypothetical protein
MGEVRTGGSVFGLEERMEHREWNIAMLPEGGPYRCLGACQVIFPWG